MEISTFAARLFECRDILHVMHLQSKSYAEHKALGKLYEFMASWTDSFLEIYKGFTSDLSFDVIHVDEKEFTDPIDYIEDFVGQVLMAAKDELATDMTTYGFLVNLIEDNIAECYHTIYKLKFLK